MQETRKYESALITGASRGLGKALALRLADEGVRLALVARGREELEQTVSEIRARHGEAFAVVGLVADVSDPRAVSPLVAQAARVVGPIELLINNASSLGPTPLGLLMDTDCEDLGLVLETNVLGPFRLIKALAGPMLLREHGLVINISSDAAIQAYPHWGSYSASKAALDHLTRIFSAELAETGVRFLSLDPGEMNTRMHADSMPDADPSTLASPREVAASIAAIIGAAGRIPSGTRLAVSEWVSEGKGL